MKRTLDLPADLWRAFDRAAEVRGSHEAVLRWWLSAGGAFETDNNDNQCPNCEGRRQFCTGYFSDGTERWEDCPRCKGKGRPTKPPRDEGDGKR